MMRILRRHATEPVVDHIPHGCTHNAAHGVDDTPVDNPRKVWQCADCGLVFRYELVPGKPYFFHTVLPVKVVS